MLFESKRLLELAGLPVEGESNVLTESAIVDESSNCEENENANVQEEYKDECEIREAVRAEIEKMWASGNIFGGKSRSKNGHVTMGFPGVGFKK